MAATQAQGPAHPVVCIDPGHPSEVGRGTRGRHLTEMHANWKIAELLKTRLEKAGCKVILTKISEEQYVRNKARAETANRAHAALMVRLHCDADSGSGFTVYYPDKPGKVDGVRGPSASVIASSGEVAKVFHDVLAGQLKGKLVDNGLKGDDRTAVGRKQGALTGSIYSKVPILLVEMCVLTNPRDEAFLASESGSAELAEALAKATLAALHHHP